MFRRISSNNNNMVDFCTNNLNVPVYVITNAGGEGRVIDIGHTLSKDMDEFLMYTYKVRRCSKMRSHDWTECPYAHRGEKARRRDPRKFPYHGIACPEFRQSGECRKGQNCEYAHGVFEFWLHPTRYRTRLCEAGLVCPRRICFFAHTQEQLRPETVHDCFQCDLRGHATTTTTTTATMAPAMSSGATPYDSLAAAMANCSLLSSSSSSSSSRRVGEEEWPDIEWVEDLVR